MRSPRLIGLLGFLLIAVSTGVSAQNAFTARPLNVRAGPDRGYPLVLQLAAGSPVQVMGCLSDWSWCDVAIDGNRGWCYAPGLSYVYQGERVPLYSYAPGLGIAIEAFSLGTYWDRYYRGRPWYAQRSTWLHRRLPPHMRPSGPPPHAGPPPRMARGGNRGAGPRPGSRAPGSAPPRNRAAPRAAAPRGRTAAPAHPKAGRPNGAGGKSGEHQKGAGQRQPAPGNGRQDRPSEDNGH